LQKNWQPNKPRRDNHYQPFSFDDSAQLQPLPSDRRSPSLVVVHALIVRLIIFETYIYMDKTTNEIFDENVARRTAEWQINDDLNYKTLQGSEVEFMLACEGQIVEVVGRLVFVDSRTEPSHSVPTIRAKHTFAGSSLTRHLSWQIAREEVGLLDPLGLQESGVHLFRLTQESPWTCEGLPHFDT
jgi:hypothetical protein